MVRIATLLLTVAAGTAVWCQTGLSFEVASIKPAQVQTGELIRSGKAHIGTKINPARVDFGSASLVSLIARACRVEGYQVFGPGWLDDARFDIQATLPAGSSTEQVPEMLRSLLEDRFKLTFHRETKEFSVYALVVGTRGPKLTQVPTGYDPEPTNHRRPLTVNAYCFWLQLALDRPVIDETHLAGEYVFDMTLVMSDVTKNTLARLNTGIAGEASEPIGGRAFHAVEALGLKLEPHKRALPVIVVDGIEKAPTEN
jgi:uncharacterized protein (TIGR03435 family)